MKDERRDETGRDERRTTRTHAVPAPSPAPNETPFTNLFIYIRRIYFITRSKCSRAKRKARHKKRQRKEKEKKSGEKKDVV